MMFREDWRLTVAGMIPPQDSRGRAESCGAGRREADSTVESSSAGGGDTPSSLTFGLERRRALAVGAVMNIPPAVRMSAVTTFRVKHENRFACFLSFGGAHTIPFVSATLFSRAATASACFFFATSSRCFLPHKWLMMKHGSNPRRVRILESQREQFPKSPHSPSVIHFLTTCS